MGALPPGKPVWLPIHSVLTLPPSVNSSPVCCRFANRTIQMVSSLLPHGRPPSLPLKDEGTVPVTSVPSSTAALYGGPKDRLAHLRDSLCSFNHQVWKQQPFQTVEGRFLSHKGVNTASFSLVLQIGDLLFHTRFFSDQKHLYPSHRQLSFWLFPAIHGDQRIIGTENSWKPRLPHRYIPVIWYFTNQRNIFMPDKSGRTETSWKNTRNA